MAYNASILSIDAKTGEVVSVFVGEVAQVEDCLVILDSNSIKVYDGTAGTERYDRMIREDLRRRGCYPRILLDDCRAYLDALSGRWPQEAPVAA